jgi:hypothetical protein
MAAPQDEGEMPVAAGISTVQCQVIGWGQTVASNYVRAIFFNR